MALHSEIESYRKVLVFRTPQGAVASVIIMRRRGAVWLTFDGAEKTTVVMDGKDASQLIAAVAAASGGATT